VTNKFQRRQKEEPGYQEKQPIYCVSGYLVAPHWVSINRLLRPLYWTGARPSQSIYGLVHGPFERVEQASFPARGTAVPFGYIDPPLARLPN
jgi:hypothetical protein